VKLNTKQVSLAQRQFQHYKRSERNPGRLSPSTFVSYLVILFFERRYPKQNTVAHLKANIFPAKKTVGFLRHCSTHKARQEKFMTEDKAVNL